MGAISFLKTKAASEDSLLMLKNISLSFGVKGVSLFVALFTTPAYMTYFSNDEVLGLWFTLLSVLSWILSCDMGIGNGLRNKIVECLSAGDRDSVKKYISSAYCFSIGVAAIVVAAIALLSQVFNWNVIFNVRESFIDSDQLSMAVGLIMVAVCLQLVLRLITSILYALQKAFVPGLLNLATNCTLLLYAIVAVKCGLTCDLPSMASAYLISVNAPLLLATVIVFSAQLKDVHPSLKWVSAKYAFDTLKLGVVFLWLQLMALLLNSTNSYLVTLFIGNEAVVQYQIYYKIFILLSTLIALATTPVWSAATKAQAENNYLWLFKLYRIFLAVGLIAVVLEFCLCLPLQLIFDFWLGGNTIQVDMTYALFFALYGSCTIWSCVVTCFANGLSELKYQTIFLTMGAIINIPLAYAFSNIVGSSIAIVWANTIAYLPYLIVQTVWMYRHLRNKVRSARA